MTELEFMHKLRCDTACSISDAKRCWELLGDDIEAARKAVKTIAFNIDEAIKYVKRRSD